MRQAGRRKVLDLPFALACILLFILLGNARSATPHPFIPGALLTMNIFIPVVAGRIKGGWEGALVGLLGPLLNSVSPAGTIFDVLSAVPYSLMGYLAGMLAEKYPTPIVALSILPGRLLTNLVFHLFGLVPEGVFGNPAFWASMAFVLYVGVVLVMFVNTLYRLVGGYNR